MRWEDQQLDAAGQAVKDAKEDDYRICNADQSPLEQGDIYDQAPRRTWMVHAFYQTLVEERIYGLIRKQPVMEGDKVEALAV